MNEVVLESYGNYTHKMELRHGVPNLVCGGPCLDFIWVVRCVVRETTLMATIGLY
jgi:hypothetical protein